ncbi:inositol monophosphatase family protein [Caldiplasma sukawensis]
MSLEIFIETGLRIKKKLELITDQVDRTGIIGIGADGTATSKLDELCEKEIFKTIEEKSFKANIISEEAGFIDRGFKENLYIDPLDGTFNAEHNIPAFTFSIALGNENTNSIRESIVYNLATGNYFHAIRGGGIFRNGKIVKPYAERSYAGVVYSLENSVMAEKLERTVTRKRIMGCASFEMALVSINSIDFVAYLGEGKKLRNIDVAAGLLLIRESGGEVYEPDGRIFSMEMDVKERKNMLAIGRNYRDELEMIMK